MFLRTFEDGDVLRRLPELQIVRVPQLHLVVAVPAQQLVHGVLSEALRRARQVSETKAKDTNKRRKKPFKKKQIKQWLTPS